MTCDVRLPSRCSTARCGRKAAYGSNLCRDWEEDHDEDARLQERIDAAASASYERWKAANTEGESHD